MATSELTFTASLEGDSYLHPHTISIGLKAFLTESVTGDERTNLITEIKCWEFFFNGAQLVPLIEQILKDGTKNSYPDINQFSEKEVEYLKNRLVNASHSFLKSRYAHLLWIRTKNNQFAQSAIDEYRNLLALYYANSVNGGHGFHLFSQILTIIHSVSLKIKYKLDELKVELVKWLKDENIPLTWRGNIIAIIADSALFKKNDVSGLTFFMLSRIEEGKESYSTTDDYLQNCLQLSFKEGVASDDIYIRMGKNELSLAEAKSEDESGLIRIASYQKAAHYFKQGNNEEEYKKALKLYTDQKSRLHFKLFQYEFSDDQVNQINTTLNNVVDKMLSLEDYNPLEYLVRNRHFLMNEADLQNEVESTINNTLTYISNTSVYDNNNNFRQLNDKGDKISFQKYQIYSFHLQTTVIPLVIKFFYKAVRTGRLNRDSIISFFNKTWFSKGLEAFTADEQKAIFSWIELLGPGLYDLVSQMEAKILDNKFKPNFILSMDSLSTKIEGVIRDLARLAKKPVTKVREGDAVEMNLEELLRDESIIGLFKDYDILLWKYVFTKNGWNLRNNTAHSFYRPTDYSENKAILLLLSIFRLCKYGDILET